MIRLMVIEDNAILVLAGLRNFFRPERDSIQVYESASCVEEAVRLAVADKFDVILLDMMIPDSTPGNNISMLKNKFPGKPIVIYTSIDSDQWRKRMFNLGVHGYVHKNDNRDTLKRAIMDAFSGKITFNMDSVNTPETGSTASALVENTLTVTEKEMLSMLADGLRYKEIGEALKMKSVTVETAIKRIRKKFGANSTPQLIHFLTEQGLM